MRRRDVIGLLAAAAGAWPFAAGAQQPSPTASALAKAKLDYGKIAHPSETDRVRYITLLVRLRDKAAAAKTDDWQAVDAEIKQHPAPQDSDGKAFAALRVGEWDSPRHNYRYRADGSWTMLPEEEGITHGTWRMEGNQSFETVATDPPQTFQYTIILITKKDFVSTDQTYVFYETRSN